MEWSKAGFEEKRTNGWGWVWDGAHGRTKESEMMVLRPGDILKVVARGTLTDCGAAACLAAWFGIALSLNVRSTEVNLFVSPSFVL